MLENGCDGVLRVHHIMQTLIVLCEGLEVLGSAAVTVAARLRTPVTLGDERLLGVSEEL